MLYLVLVQITLVDGSTQRSEPPCNIREYLPGTYDTSKSLVLLHYDASARFSKDLMNAIRTCYAAASNRWANFIVVANEEVWIMLTIELSLLLHAYTPITR